MNAFYLRGTDREALVNACVEAGVCDPALKPVGNCSAVCDVGILLEPTGDLDADGVPTMHSVRDLEGVPYQHINLLLEGSLPAGLQLFSVQPDDPKQMFWLT